MYKQPYSHPDKDLIIHIKGIFNNIDSRNFILTYAILFHDIGKINKNFQDKLFNKNISEYSNHSYISVYYLINFFLSNLDEIKKNYNYVTDDNFFIYILIISNIIKGHHGSLNDINNVVNEDEWNKMVTFLKKTNLTLDVLDFFINNKQILNIPFDVKFNVDSDRIKSYTVITKVFENKFNNIWCNNAIDYYLETINAYSELINGDRRDASNNLSYYRNSKKSYLEILDQNLNKKLKSFKPNLFKIIYKKITKKFDINDYRTNISNDALLALIKSIKSNNRIFSLASPTGSGKTYMLLRLALEITKKNNYKYDIIYTLPYLSIIDQVKIDINNLLKPNYEVLTYSSASDTTNKLQELINNLDKKSDKESDKELLEYSFSENIFDHPIIITTFNQIFETLLTNYGSKIIKLKNFKNRIFLIDEYQTIEPTQYYIFYQLMKKFCEKYDSYAILSTATMPNFNINDPNVIKLFGKKTEPIKLLSEDVFKISIFNRYNINFSGEVNEFILYDMVLKHSQYSTLLIMNTIKSSKKMYDMFKLNKNFQKTYILNSQLSPNDRINNINKIKNDLNNNIKILVISTQVIEAGVDIDFPQLFRDAAPPSSIVQSCGRTNRNGKNKNKSDVFLFLFKDSTETRYDCNMVYHNKMSNYFKEWIKDKISSMDEHTFFEYCKKYFYGLSKYCIPGEYERKDINGNFNLVTQILNGKFKEIGQHYRYILADCDTKLVYVGNNIDDWNLYKQNYYKMIQSKTYRERNINTNKFKEIKTKIILNSINLRIKYFNQLEIDQQDICGIYKLIENVYDPNIGIIKKFN